MIRLTRNFNKARFRSQRFRSSHLNQKLSILGMRDSAQHRLNLIRERQLETGHITQCRLLGQELIGDDDAVTGALQNRPDAIVEVDGHPVESSVQATRLQRWPAISINFLN